MKTKNIVIILFAAVVAMLTNSCGVVKKVYKIPDEVDVQLVPWNSSVPAVYKDVDKTIRLQITSKVSKEDMYDDSVLPSLTRKTLPRYNFVPSVNSFAQEATTEYMQKMRLDVDNNGDYCIDINIDRFKLTWISKNSVECSVRLTYRLLDNAGQTLITTTSAFSNIRLAQTENFGVGMGRAFTTALNQINWDRIAKYLTIGSTPKDEKNAQVKGAGDTALEHTVIRWFITSAPQGADVTWRIVSSTPDVANTNSNYIGTTPYESTESFDIRGLTFENSGNVQVEVSCEKPGYMTQRKRFNLRQAIEQKEISAKFNLIKDE